MALQYQAYKSSFNRISTYGVNCFYFSDSQSVWHYTQGWSEECLGVMRSLSNFLEENEKFVSYLYDAIRKNGEKRNILKFSFIFTWIKEEIIKCLMLMLVN